MDYDENQWGRRAGLPRSGTDDAAQPVQMAPQQDLYAHQVPARIPPGPIPPTTPRTATRRLTTGWDTYEAHVREHVEYMQQNLEAWQAAQNRAAR